MFVGREQELKELKDRFSNDKMEIISVLGRRRVGKSQLIHEASKGFDGIVIAFECSDTSFHDNLLELNKIIQESFHQPFLRFESLTDILIFLHQEAAHRKVLFILDEYPYMREGRSTDSQIKNAIDAINLLDTQNPLKFVVCGSAVDTMEMLDDADMPLHGRFNAVITLHPLDYLHSSLFYENASYEDKIRYYAVFGGVPYFLKQIDSNRSFDENVISLFFAENGLLRGELEIQIQGEINKIEHASFILNILKNKSKSYSDIQQLFRSAFPGGKIDYALNKLIRMRIVEKYSVWQNNGVAKPYYRIVDNAVSFYYAFLLQPVVNRLLFSTSDYYEMFIKERLYHEFIPHMFEQISYQFILLMNRARCLPFMLVDLFTYTINDKATKSNYQFDIVGKTPDGLVNFECKFQNDIIHAHDVYKESRQAELASSDFVQTIFISKSAVEGNHLCYRLEDMFQPKLLK